MQNWKIRRAEISDAMDLCKCIDAAYAQYSDRIADLPAVLANCTEEIAENLVWVAEADGEIVGGLVLIPAECFMLLANVAVHPSTRGTGIGRQLLTLAESESVDRGYAEMRLSTHVDMPENIERYARNGWSEINRTETKVMMKKKLRK